MPKKKLSERWAKNTPISRQLRGMECEHPRGKRTVVVNSKGKEFWECEKCGAFLGWK